jgi:hypothetical protein
MSEYPARQLALKALNMTVTLALCAQAKAALPVDNA